MSLQDLYANISAERDAWKTLDSPHWKVLDYLLTNGEGFKGQQLPGRYRKRIIKQCFHNAWQLVRSSKTLRYVEGRCAGGPVPFPFDHAWAIDKAGKVIDPTLRDCEQYVYFGVIFRREELPTRYSNMLTPLQKRIIDTLSSS